MIPSKEALREEIRMIAQQELNLREDELSEDLAGNLDSLQRLSFVVALEDHYEICFDPDDDQGPQTFSDVIALVEQKLRARHSSEAGA